MLCSRNLDLCKLSTRKLGAQANSLRNTKAHNFRVNREVTLKTANWRIQAERKKKKAEMMKNTILSANI